MRKIEQAMCAAVKARRNWSSGNTQVIVSLDRVHVEVYLHGNIIYTESSGVKCFTLAGWNTPTTRSRLRALGVNVSTKNYVPMYKGAVINENKWYNI